MLAHAATSILLIIFAAPDDQSDALALIEHLGGRYYVDPGKPGHIKAAFDKGDHLHPNKAGYEAMAAAIDLKLLAAE